MSRWRRDPTSRQALTAPAEASAADDFERAEGWPAPSPGVPADAGIVIPSGDRSDIYSAYERGLDAVWGMSQWLDRAPLGRNETGHWWRRHDEYDAP